MQDYNGEDVKSLSHQITHLNLPEFKGVRKSSRIEGKPPQLIIKCGELTEEHLVALIAVIEDHSAIYAASLLPVWDDVRALQSKLFSKTNAGWRIARYQTQEPLGNTDETWEKYNEMLNYLQDIRINDEATHATPQDALDALNNLTEPT